MAKAKLQNEEKKRGSVRKPTTLSIDRTSTAYKTILQGAKGGNLEASVSTERMSEKEFISAVFSKK